MNRMQDLVAVVTGSSRGLGRAIALEYAREGARVVACARPASPSGLAGTVRQTVNDIESLGAEAMAVSCDVTDEGQVRAMVDQVLERFGRVDVLVNNAGLMIPGETFMDIEPQRWDALMAVNVRGPYLTCRYFLPGMLERGKGSIINVGSGAASNPRVGGTVYCASKAALHAFSLSLAKEVKDHNIAVNVYDPGPMRSEGASVIPWAQHDWHLRVESHEAAPPTVFLALQDGGSFTDQVVRQADFGSTWGIGF